MLNTSFRAARLVKASPLFALGFVFMGAAGNCGFIEPPVCAEEVGVLCEEGEVPIDTDGDGCEDSCEPEINCLAEPVCNVGDTQVDGPDACLQDDAVCYDVETCGTTIWCTGPATTGCYVNQDCPTGEICDTENYCDSPCGDNADCLIACMGRCVENTNCDAAQLLCEDGEEPADTNGDGCVDSCEFVGYDLCWSNDECQGGQVCDTENYCESPCGPNDANCLIACLGRCVDEVVCNIAIDCAPGYFAVDTDSDGCDDSCVIDECDGIPVCQAGEVEVDQTTCEIADIQCVERTTCGQTIFCTPSETSGSCWTNDDCSGGLVCDTLNYCEAPPECLPNEPCEPVCAGLCVSDVVCPDIELMCEDGLVPGDADGDGCEDDCVSGEECLALPTCGPNETMVESQSGCLQDDAVCYDVTVCGTTIWCTGPA